MKNIPDSSLFKLWTQENVEGDNKGSTFIIVAMGMTLENFPMKIEKVLSCDRGCDIIVEASSFMEFQVCFYKQQEGERGSTPVRIG